MFRLRLILGLALTVSGLAGACWSAPSPLTPTPPASAAAPLTHAPSPSPSAARPVAASATASATETPTPTVPPPAATASATVSVTPARVQPVIHSFTAEPALIDPGAAVTLRWSVTAERAVIYRLDALGRLTLPDYPVPLEGSLVISPPAESGASVNFVLFALSGDQTAQAGVAVAQRCLDTWFFPNPPPTCPSRPAAFSALVTQTFERGRMLWLSDARQIYILYDDVRGPRWQLRPDEWAPGRPEDDPALTPPAGRFQPVRGFGLAWRDAGAPEGTRARDYLGWALAPEIEAGPGAAQCDSAPKYGTCFVGGADGVVYKLEPEGSRWSIWAGP